MIPASPSVGLERRSVMRRLVLMLALVAASCGDARRPVEPTLSFSPSSPNPASPVTSFAVSGAVRDTHLNGLSDVPVEIVDGPMSGTVVRTDVHGLFRFPEAFAEEATLRATKAGYLTATARALRPAIPTVGVRSRTRQSNCRRPRLPSIFLELTRSRWASARRARSFRNR